MRKIILICSLVIAALSSYAQPVVQRSNGLNTVLDPNLFTSKGFRVPVFADTSAANAVQSLDSSGKLIYTFDVNGFWYRGNNPKTWIRFSDAANPQSPSVVTIVDSSHISICNVNSCDTVLVNVVAQTINIQNDSTIIVCSYGNDCDTINITPTPLIPTGVYVDSVYTTVASKMDSLWQSKDGDTSLIHIFDRNCGMIQAGLVVHDSVLKYSISPSIYILCSDGIRRTTSQTQVTLDPADASHDRIDAIILDSSGVNVLTGVPDANPAAPQITDKQLLITYIIVPAGATEPTACDSTDLTIYDENTEWTGSAVGTATFSDATNPAHGTKDIAISGGACDITFTNSQPIGASSYTTLEMYVVIGAKWGGFKPSIQLSWYDASDRAVSNIVVVSDGLYGFSRKILGDYQKITVPISDWSFTGNPSKLQVSFAFIGGSSYLDYVRLSGACITQPSTVSNVNGFGVVTTGNGAATSNKPNDNLTISDGYGISTSASGKTLVISVDTTKISTGIVAYNGLTEVGTDSVKLGGTLTENTTITQNGFTTTFSSTTAGGVSALTAESTTGNGLKGISTNGGIGIVGTSTSYLGAYIETTNSTTSSVEDIMQIRRTTTGTAANGIGGALVFQTEQTSGSSNPSNKIISKWTDASATRTSQLTITGVNSGTTQNYLTLQPSYQLVNNDADTLATRAYSRSVGGGGVGAVTTAVDLTDAATISTDATLGFVAGATYRVTLGGNRAIANPTGLSDGQVIVYELHQDATGSRTVTWDTMFTWSTDVPLPTLSTTSNYVDQISFVYNSTDGKLYVRGVNLGAH